MCSSDLLALKRAVAYDEDYTQRRRETQGESKGRHVSGTLKRRGSQQVENGRTYENFRKNSFTVGRRGADK